jgi:DmsE family decaheme c-type cytochrome
MMLHPGTAVLCRALLGALVLWFGTFVPGAAQRVNWESIDAGFKGATFVRNDGVCADCHDAPIHRFTNSSHAQYFVADRTVLQGGCEACHGPRSEHVEDERPLSHWSDLTAAQQSGICMQCHAGGSRMNFKTGAHMAADVSCTTCHDAKQPHPSRGSVARASTVEACYTCHNEVRGQMSKASHHPVREGRMDCASCHNVHGSSPSLMKTPTITETCASCHADKRGPFLWEHAPVRESCANCHEAHGSTNRKLLNRKESFVCMQCHSYGGHINLPRYNRTSNPYGEGCVNCHMTVHGSNHPSGAKLVR